MSTEILTGLNPDIRPCIINFRYWAYMLDGDNIPRYFDQNGAYEWMHLDPTTVLVVNVAAAGNLTGVYKYFYTEYNIVSGDGDMQSGHETNPSPIYTTASVSLKKAVLTLPATAQNTGFTHLKIYATLADAEIFYYIGNVAIGTTTFEDNNEVRLLTVPFGEVDENADGTFTQTYLNYPVANHKYCVATKTRILTFGARDKVDGTVSCANGSTAVTGTDTLWTRSLVGSAIYFDGESKGYVIASVATATSLTLTLARDGDSVTDVNYAVLLDDSVIRYSAKHPTTAKPMWWAFPDDHFRRIIRDDHSGFTGAGVIGDNVVIFKRGSHYILTENGDEFIDQESNTKVGTDSHWSIVSEPTSGNLVFLSTQGKLFATSGTQAVDLNVDLSETVDGLNTSRLEHTAAVWYPEKQWYVMIYASEDSSYEDRILVYDFRLKQWTILNIEASCIALIESEASGKKTWKPWIGTRGGFVYELFSGYTLGADTSFTLKGTATAFAAATLTDSTATFETTGDGLEDVDVSLYDAAGTYKETVKIASNTATEITAASNWTTSPVAGWTYEIGSIRWHWESKVFDVNEGVSQTVRGVLLNFKKVAVSRTVSVHFYFSEDADLFGDTASQTVEFDLSKDYYEPESLADNRARYFKFRIEGHGSNEPVVINNIKLDIVPHNR